MLIAAPTAVAGRGNYAGIHIDRRRGCCCEGFDAGGISPIFIAWTRFALASVIVLLPFYG
jgi:hypothetical protein